MLSLDHIGKSYNGQPIINHFNLNMKRGSFTVLIGPSGCGKTTLFDLLTGTIDRDEGVITWLGESLPHLGKAAAYMQQKDLLLPWLTLNENALLPRAFAKQNSCDIQKKVKELFKRFGLENFDSYFPRAVSGGMRQRCALIRTLMFEREIVLLDEPLSALDAITRKSLQTLMLTLQNDFHKTVLMITHDIDEALFLADTIIVLTQPPMNIRETITLSSKKPRDLNSGKYIALKKKILLELEEEMKS